MKLKTTITAQNAHTQTTLVVITNTIKAEPGPWKRNDSKTFHSDQVNRAHDALRSQYNVNEITLR